MRLCSIKNYEKRQGLKRASALDVSIEIKDTLVLGVSVPLSLYQKMEAPTTEVLWSRCMYTNLRALPTIVLYMYTFVLFIIWCCIKCTEWSDGSKDGLHAVFL